MEPRPKALTLGRFMLFAKLLLTGSKQTMAIHRFPW